MTIKYEFTLCIGLAGCDRTDSFSTSDWGYDDDDWNGLSEKEKGEILSQELKEWAYQYVEYSASLVEGE